MELNSAGECAGLEDVVNVSYCDWNTNDCNGGIDNGELEDNDSSGVYEACKDVTFAGHEDWRVPTKAELTSLIKCSDGTFPADNDSCGVGNFTAPTIDTVKFPDFPSHFFWSSTSNNEQTGWGVNFSTGLLFGDFGSTRAFKNYQGYVLCVRDENSEITRRNELLECVVEAGGCDVILSPVDDSTSAFHNFIMPADYGVPIGSTYAGQTLCIPSGNYNGIALYGLQGTATAPVEVTNCGEGQVIVDGHGTGGLTVDDGQYLRFTGTGDPNQLYGFVIGNAGDGRSIFRAKGDETGVTDIEVEYFELLGPAYAGITISNYPYCNPALDRAVFTQANTLVHHNYIHDIRNELGENGGEGIYIGGSHYFMDESPTSDGCSTGYAEPSLRGVEVYKNLIENTGRDGIQVGAAVENMAIHHNTVRRYALSENYGHVGGIQVNPGSVGHIYANLIESDPNTTAETAFQVAGGLDGPTYIYNNVIIDAAIPLAFLTNMGNENSPIYVHNNTLINKYIAPTEGVASSGTSTLYLNCSFDGSGTIQDFYFSNNIFTNYGSVGRYIYGPIGDHYSKYYSDDGCLINGRTYDNDLDLNLMLSGNLYEQDPYQVGFLDYAAGDYHLDSTSPAVGAGEDLSHIFTEDFDGNDRGTGAPFDMGAYHYQ